jgi:hypothetical protein
VPGNTPASTVTGCLMPDPQTLYGVAAIITALSPVAIAAIVETGRFLRSRRGRGEPPSDPLDLQR